MRTDIAFIKPAGAKRLYGELSDFGLTAVEPPFWAALWAAFLREKGYSVALLDAEALGLGPAEIADWVRDVDPLLACVVVSGTNPSASTMNMVGAGDLLRRLRQAAPTTRTMLAGLHPSALPDQTLREEDADFLCQGEGFATFPGLIDALRAKATEAEIPGLWRKTGDTVTSAPRPSLLEDLGVLPMPAWDLLPMDRYRAHNWHCFDDITRRQPYAVIATSLGCPFNCSFCCINSFFGKNTIRYRPVEAVLAEIDHLVTRYGVRNIKILDEMFAMNESRVVSLCSGLIARGYDLNIWAYARTNTITKPMLDAMRAAGIRWLAYGFESASERVMRDVSKNFGTERSAAAAAMTREAGIYICANFIFGLPEDDYASMNETLAFMIEMNAEWANIYSAMGFPGSKLYEEALRQGWPLPKSWGGYSQYSADCLPLPTRHLTGGQVLAFRDYAFHAYYANPAYLSMLKRTFGEAAMNYIREVTAKRLPRDHSTI